jgi:hypothetical protein
MATLDPSTFEYLVPTDEQKTTIDRVRMATALYASVLDVNVPGGADKTYLLRKLREVAMWANAAIMRNTDGSPREDDHGNQG